MATGAQTWSKTAASNATADTNINWAEGMAPSQVNDSARAQMASQAMYRDDNSGTLVTSGSSTAFTVTTNQVAAALTAGYTVSVQFHATVDTSATLNQDGLGAKPLQIYAGTNFQGGEFVAGSIGSFTYSSTGTGQWIAKGLPQLATHSVTLPKLGTTAGNPPFGFDVPINLQLNASVGSSLLTIAVKTNSGNDPSTTDPVYIPFRDTTIANGDPVWVSITSALSISTNAVGATLGAANNVPFRIWILAFNNAGTVVLALWHSGAGASSPTTINVLNETALQSTTGISAAATSAGVFYTPNGTSLTSKAFRIIGLATYETALATAGTYSAVPDNLMLFGPGVAKPGNILQVKTGVATPTAITPSSKTSLIIAQACGNIGATANASSAYSSTIAISRGGVLLSQTASGVNGLGTIQSISNPFSLVTFDNPQTSGSASYSVSVTAQTALSSVSINNPSFLLQEVMG